MLSTADNQPDTDHKNVKPESKKNRHQIQFLDLFADQESLTLFKQIFSTAAQDDPILVIEWNPVWLLNPANLTGK